MRTSNFFLWGTALFFAITVAGMLFATYAPGYGETGRAILFTALAMFPAFIATAFLFIAASARVLDRATAHRPQSG